MAEAWRLEEEEEERRELGRRHRRGNLHPAADRSERNKPDYRSSGQGPLSSIRAAIKRTSRTSHTEHQRDRRRPEITIVAAEPLGPSSWFPGGNITPHGLGFPPPSQANWRTDELVPAELPPSYEQVIKEINQVQVTTTNNNNAAAARCTATSATQTDFPEEIITHLPKSNVKSNSPTLCESETLPAVQSPLRPPRPVLNSSPSENEAPLVVFDASEERKCQENPSNVTGPVPKPRSKGNLRPVVRDSQSKLQDNQQEVSQPRTEREPSPNQPEYLLVDSLLDNHMVIRSMNTEKSQNSIGSRIKAFETQANSDISGLSKKPEVTPRSFVSRPSVSAKKPVVAPKPELAARRTSGESGSWTGNSQKAGPREWHPPPQEAGSNIVTKPELPKKPKPGLVKSTSNELLDARNGSASENNDEQKKFPVPAPRPLIPKKSLSVESPTPYLTLLKPVIAAPNLSLAAQATSFKSLRESAAPTNLSTCTVQSKPVGEGDLISFDDDVLPPSSVSEIQEYTSSEAAADPFQLSPKNEPAKEQIVQPAVARKPTVIRIPAKLGKPSNEVPHIPPPLPAEKPIGNTSRVVAGKPGNAKQTRKEEFEQPDRTGAAWIAPVLPPRPVNGRIVTVRLPPPKSIPGRPPPPKHTGTKISSQKDPCCRSSSDITLHKRLDAFGMGVKRTKSQVLKKQDPSLPPRPKPGHPLYNKYMLPVPHGIATEDFSPRNPGELSFKRGDVLVLLKQIDSNYFKCQKGEEIGKVRLSHMKIITRLEEHLCPSMVCTIDGP